MGRSTSGPSLPVAAPQTSARRGPAERDRPARARRSASPPSEQGSTFECSLDGAAFAACDPPSGTGLAPGDHVFEVRAIDADGNRTRRRPSHAWTVVGRGQLETTIAVGPPAETIETGRVRVLRNAARRDVRVLARRRAFEPASAGRVQRPRAGRPRLRGARVDGRDARAGARPRRKWGVVGAPVTVQRRPGRSDHRADARFEFSADQAASTYALLARRRRAGAVRVAGAVRRPRRRGPHVRGRRRRTRTALVEETPAVHEWTVDGPAEPTPPETEITAGPPAATARAGRHVRVHRHRQRDRPPLELELRVRAERRRVREPARRRTSWPDLAPGRRTRCAVRAVDAAGNADQSPATRAGTVMDTARPRRRSTPGRTARPGDERDVRVLRRRGRRDLRVLARRRRRSRPARRRTRSTGSRSATTRMRRAGARRGRQRRLRRPPRYAWTVEPPPDTTAPVTR